jgi:hypothetical protein
LKIFSKECEVSPEQLGAEGHAFETRDFYLACFLRCCGYELLDLCNQGGRKFFVFLDWPTRRQTCSPSMVMLRPSARWLSSPPSRI